MPGHSAPRRAAVLVTVLAAVVALGACSSSPGTATSPSATAPSLASLPETALAELPGVSYEESPNSRAAYQRTGVAARVHAFTAAVSRDVVVDGRTVACVQLYRFAPDVAVGERSRFVPMLVFELAGRSPTPAQMGGKQVQVAPAVSGRPAVVGWQSGDSLLLVSAHDLTTAEDWAARIVLRSMASSG